MNAPHYKAALSIMEEMINRPIMASLVNTVGYYKVSTSLEQIEDNLKAGEFSKVEDWKKTIEDFFEEVYECEPAVYLHPIIDNCKVIFESLYRSKIFVTKSDWCHEVYRLRTKLTDLFYTPTQKIRQMGSSSLFSKQAKHNTSLLSEIEMARLMSAIELLKTDKHEAEMLQIINEFQPDLDVGNADVFIDLQRLDIQTFQALKIYAKRALSELGKPYPN